MTVTATSRAAYHSNRQDGTQSAASSTSWATRPIVRPRDKRTYRHRPNLVRGERLPRAHQAWGRRGAGLHGLEVSVGLDI